MLRANYTRQKKAKLSAHTKNHSHCFGDVFLKSFFFHNQRCISQKYQSANNKLFDVFLILLREGFAEEAGTSVTFLLPYSLAYSGDRAA